MCNTCTKQLNPLTSKSSTFPPLIITDVFTVRRGWEVVAAFCVPLLQAVVIWITVAFQHGKCISFHTTAARSLDVFLSLCEPSSSQARSVHVCVSRSDCHQYISVGQKDQTPLFISAQTYLGYYFEKLIGPGLMHMALSCDSLLHGCHSGFIEDGCSQPVLCLTSPPIFKHELHIGWLFNNLRGKDGDRLWCVTVRISHYSTTAASSIAPFTHLKKSFNFSVIGPLYKC